VTQQLYHQLSQLQPNQECAYGYVAASGDSSSRRSDSSSRAVEASSAYLALLAKVMNLSQEQLMQQLVGEETAAAEV
jgi:hypothetical protein